MTIVSTPPQLAEIVSNVHPFAYSLPVSGWGAEDKIVYSDVEFSLVFVVDRQAEKVLLGFKKRGFGVHLYNGFGGKPEAKETMLECAIRELEEESGLSAEKVDPRGSLFIARPHTRSSTSTECDIKFMIRIHLYSCESWTGEVCETEEMSPEWFDINPGNAKSLPVDQMWPDASFYVPRLLDSVLYGESNERLCARVDYEILSLEEAPTSLPPLDGLRVGKRTDASRMERLSGWWMCLSSNDSVDRL